MKVLVNGGINLSELDGWWAEAYTPEVGWALGDGLEHADDPAWDAAEAVALYECLEQEVVPDYYNRNESGIPVAWVDRMRKSMARLTPKYSADRTVREYAERYYIPAATAYNDRSANNGDAGVQIVNWHHMLRDNWSDLHLGEVTITSSADSLLFEAEVFFCGIDAEAVDVELYANESSCENPLRLVMKPCSQLTSAEQGVLYKAQVPGIRSPEDFNIRIVPRYPGVAVPLEDIHILWQR
jgi:starch phosphorylase